MTKQTKIILAVVGGVLVLCMLACVGGFLLFSVAGGALVANVAQSVEEDPVKVQQAANDIVDFDVPAGYTQANSMEILGMKLVMWNDQTQNSMIMLLQMPMQAEINEQTMRQMEEALRRQRNNDLRNMRTIEERDLTIRGKPARMVVMEGEDPETGERYHQLLVAFQGKGGMALLMMINPSRQQNLTLYDNIVDSIR